MLRVSSNNTCVSCSSYSLNRKTAAAATESETIADTAECTNEKEHTSTKSSKPQRKTRQSKPTISQKYNTIKGQVVALLKDLFIIPPGVEQTMEGRMNRRHQGGRYGGTGMAKVM